MYGFPVPVGAYYSGVMNVGFDTTIQATIVDRRRRPPRRAVYESGYRYTNFSA